MINTAFEVKFEGVGRTFAAAHNSRSARAERKGNTINATSNATSTATSTKESVTTAGDEPREVLNDVSITVAPGELVVILGTSGCGKSTLLRIASGLDTGYVGDVSIDGTPVFGIDPRCAFAFPAPRLLPWRTIAKNVALGLPRGFDKVAGAERVTELLELVGLSESMHLRPREVSGGMAQRASLARALARNPGVLLLDEPFGALDALTRMKMQDLLLEIHAAAPTTILLVTHDVDEALQLADRVVLLGRMPGQPGSTITELLSVPGNRPRDRGSAELAEIRAHLLEGLGIDRHRA